MTPSQFVPFGMQHAAATGLVVVSAVGLSLAVRRWASPRAERVVRWALALGCLGYMAFDITWRLTAGHAEWQDALPLDLCDLSVLLAPVVLLTRNRRAYEVLYFWGIGGALQAVVQPIVSEGFPALTCICFFLHHALAIAAALYATVVLRLRPAAGAILRVWIITNAYAAVLFPINLLLDTNYMFLAERPPTPSLLDLLGPWPWYILTVQPIVVLVLFLCHLPFLLRDQRRGNDGQC